MNPRGAAENWSIARPGVRAYSYDQFRLAKAFVFRKWGEWALVRGVAPPQDLSGACRYGSLFICRVYGGSIQGHYQHQYNRVEGRCVDLSHDAADVGAMTDPYRHEPSYFELPEQQASLQGCLPRVDRWVAEYLTAS